jgi:endo-1,4-beta-xylanase
MRAMTNPEQTHTSPAEITRRLFLKGALAVGEAVLLEGCSSNEPEYGEKVVPHISMETHEITKPEDLLAKGTWQYFPGARATTQGLELTPLGREIMNKHADNARNPNPPVNLFGSRLQVTGDFAVHSTVSGNTPASLDFYGATPLHFDDIRLERSRIECATEGNAITVRVWDGSTQIPSEQTFHFNGPTDSRAISMKRQGDHITLSVNDQSACTLPGANHLFANGEVWFGADTKHSPSTLHNLVVEPLASGHVQAVDTSTLRVTQKLPDGGLQSKVRRPNFKLGTAVSLNFFSDPVYAEINAGGEVAYWTPENAFKPSEIQPIEGVFNFAEIDSLAELAKRHGIELRGHTLIYSKSLPKWMEDLPTATEADIRRVQEVLEAHVTAAVTHGKSLGIKVYDVVNEAVAGFGNNAHVDTDNVFYRALGEKYIDIVFWAARRADPEAKLYLNDFGLETHKQREDQEFGIAERMINRGTPIDGIGVQGHVQQLPRDKIKPEVLQAMAKRAQALGLELAITELDITGDDADDQRDQYASTFKTALQLANCTSITTWGLHDGVGSTSTYKNNQLNPGNALLYGSDGRPKTSIRNAIIDALAA